MDYEGFRAWLDRQDLQPTTRRDALSNCRRVEDTLGIDLDVVHTKTDLEAIRTRLWDHMSNSHVIRNLVWAVWKYV